MCCYLLETQQLCFVSQANHGGVRGKLPKEIEEEEVVENMEDLENSTDEFMATPNDDNEVNKTCFYVKIIFVCINLIFLLYPPLKCSIALLANQFEALSPIISCLHFSILFLDRIAVLKCLLFKLILPED